MNFIEAFKAFNEGKIITRGSLLKNYWRNNFDPCKSNSFRIYKYDYLADPYESDEDIFSYEDIIATDWIISDDSIPDWVSDMDG